SAPSRSARSAWASPSAASSSAAGARRKPAHLRGRFPVAASCLICASEYAPLSMKAKSVLPLAQTPPGLPFPPAVPPTLPQVQPLGPASRAVPDAFAQRRRSAGVSFIATVHGTRSASTVHVVPATWRETRSALATFGLRSQSAAGP